MDEAEKNKIRMLIGSVGELKDIIMARVNKSEADWQSLQSADYNAEQVGKLLDGPNWKALYRNEMNRGLEI